MSSRYKFVGALGISKKVIAVGVFSTSDDLEVNCHKSIMKELLDKCVSESYTLTDQDITTVLRLCNEDEHFRKALCEQSVSSDGTNTSPLYWLKLNEFSDEHTTELLSLCNEYDDIRKALCEQSVFSDGEKKSPIYELTLNEFSNEHITELLSLCKDYDDIRKALCEQSVFSDDGKRSPIYMLTLN